jgi:formylglycine-generating enzyme
MRPLAVLLYLAIAACGDQTAEPPPQWNVVLATDVHVPGFADRLLIEAGRCVADIAGCDSATTRTFAVDETSWPLSFGVAATDRTVPLRARLFRADRTLGGKPDPAWTVDVLAELPPIDAPTTVTLTLTMECMGVESDPVSWKTCDASSRLLRSPPLLAPGGDVAELPREGSWRRQACSRDAPPSMVCVPGGSFLLGQENVPKTCSVRPRPEPERLVTLSPFFIDVDEFTVGELRELLNQGRVSGEPLLASVEYFGVGCTYLGKSVADADRLPANCVTYETAWLACRALGKRLPTEAEWEYVASNLGRETPYPWGFDGDVCSHAVIARGIPDDAIDDHSCSLQTGVPPGLVAGGSDADRTELGVRNLGGSVSEMLEDFFADYSDECWKKLGFAAKDPVCTIPGVGLYNFERSARGGSFVLPPSDAEVYLRGVAYPSVDLTTDPFLADKGSGFRCAQSDSEAD